MEFEQNFVFIPLWSLSALNEFVLFRVKLEIRLTGNTSRSRKGPALCMNKENMSIGKRYLIVKKAKTKRPKRGKNERKKCLRGELNPVHMHAKSSHRLLRHMMAKLLSVVKAFSREILVVDAVCSGGAVLINNSRGLFQENKHCFGVKSVNLTHFIWRIMAD